MTMQTAYEAKNFLFSSQEEAERFERSLSLEDFGEGNFSCMFLRPRKTLVKATIKILTDIDALYDEEYLPSETEILLLAKETSDHGSSLKLYKVLYYVDDRLIDVYKKSSLYADYRDNLDCAFTKVDSEASQYWIRTVNAAELKKDILTPQDMRLALMQLFEKRIYK